MIRLGDVFQSGMVLQRDKKLNVWGEAQANAKVCVRIQGKEAVAEADANGKWCVELEPLQASQEETLFVECAGEQLTLTGVAVGEVWIAGGQSNMEFWMRYEKHCKEEKEIRENPNVRFYDVPEIIYEDQTKDFDYHEVGIWRKATAEDLEYFSAVGYYFAKEMEAALHVPVAIVGCNWGGTNSSVWMSEKSVKTYGKVWMEAFAEMTCGKDMKKLWEKQSTNPMCDRGRPFADPFSEFTLPITRSQEEVNRFFAEQNFSFDPENIILFQKPGILYETMVKKIAPFTARGVLWYQGESDDGEGKAELYDKMLTAMIHDWRVQWEEELPFLVVQLPGYEQWGETPNLCYSVIRSCQKKVADTVPEVYLASISDAGEQFDIHPKNKKIVGHRLALLARGHIYGEELLCDAPAADAYQAEENKIRIHFANAEGGLECENMEQLPLEVKQNGESVSVTARIDGEILELTAGQPLSGELEIAFAQEKYYCVELKNKSDVPAIPFLKKISVR